MLGAAKADAFSAEFHRHFRIVWRIGIGAHLEAARSVGPLHHGREIAGQLRLDHLRRAEQHLPRRTIDGDDLAALDHAAASGELARLHVDADVASAGDARPPHAARHNSGVAGHAAARGDDRL